VDLPVVAIGGINSDNIQQVIDCGVSGVAMIQGVFIENMTLSESITLLQDKFKNVPHET
jgi:thiamine monophosphate synthase